MSIETAHSYTCGMTSTPFVFLVEAYGFQIHTDKSISRAASWEGSIWQNRKLRSVLSFCFHPFYIPICHPRTEYSIQQEWPSSINCLHRHPSFPGNVFLARRERQPPWIDPSKQALISVKILASYIPWLCDMDWGAQAAIPPQRCTSFLHTPSCPSPKLVGTSWLSSPGPSTFNPGPIRGIQFQKQLAGLSRPPQHRWESKFLNRGQALPYTESCHTALYQNQSSWWQERRFPAGVKCRDFYPTHQAPSKMERIRSLPVGVVRPAPDVSTAYCLLIESFTNSDH